MVLSVINIPNMCGIEKHHVSALFVEVSTVVRFATHRASGRVRAESRAWKSVEAGVRSTFSSSGVP